MLWLPLLSVFPIVAVVFVTGASTAPSHAQDSSPTPRS